MVENWLQDLHQLCEFAKTEPQAAYAAYCHGYKSKFTYFMRTIEGLKNFLQPIEDLLTTKLIPVLFGDITISQKEKLLYSLPTREEGLGIGIMEEKSLTQYKANKLFTAHLVSLIAEPLPLGKRGGGGANAPQILIMAFLIFINLGKC